MLFLIVGVLLLVLHVAGIGPVAGWHWAFIALPFVLAAAWWAFADATGLTRRRQERKIEDRKVARRERDMEALGLKTTTRGSSKRRRGAAPPRRDGPA